MFLSQPTAATPAKAIAAVDPKSIPIDKDGHERVADSLPDVYLQALQAQIERVEPGANRPLRAVYTAMHGVGAPLCEAALRAEGVDVVSVPTQRDPDPTFPTVAFPNPEEAGALDQAEALANAHGIDLVLANDPDADRLAVMVRVDGRLHRLTGAGRRPLGSRRRRGGLGPPVCGYDDRLLRASVPRRAPLSGGLCRDVDWVQMVVERRLGAHEPRGSIRLLL